MKKIFRNDTTIRVISVLIAVLLWMYVVSVNNPTVSIMMRAVPVQIANDKNFNNAGLQIFSTDDKYVDVRVEGRHSEISKLYSSDIVAQMDMSDITEPGEYNIDISIHCKIPNVDIIETTATKTDVFVDRMVSVNKEIVVQTKGSPKEGLCVDTKTPSDKYVLVSGPESVVNNIKYAIAYVDVSGASEAISKNSTLEIVGENDKQADLTYVKTNITHTTANVTFAREKEVEVSLDFVSPNIYNKYDVEFTPKEVRITGNTEIIKTVSEIKTEKIKLPADALDKSVVEIEAKLDIPNNVSIVDDVQSIKVTLKLKE